MKAGCWDTPLALQDLAEAIPIISENRLPLDWEQFSDRPRPFTWTHLHSLIFTLSVGPPPPPPSLLLKLPLPYTASNSYYILMQLLSVTKIKCYLTISRGNFLEMQYDFYRYALLADLLWFVVERAFTRNSRKLERDCLEHHCKKSLKLCDWSNTQVCFYWQEKLE